MEFAFLAAFLVFIQLVEYLIALLRIDWTWYEPKNLSIPAFDIILNSQ